MQVLVHLLGLHHGGAPLGQRRFLTRLGLEPGELLDRVAQPLRLAPRRLDPRAMRLDRLAGVARLRPRARHRAGVVLELSERIEQRAMGGDVDQRALVVLTVDLDQRLPEAFEHLHAERLVVDEGPGAAVGELYAAQDQLVLRGDVVDGKDRARGMAGRHVETGGHLPLFGAMAHQGGVAARAERERERVEQDRFPGAGLAGQGREAGGEIDVEPIDQDDIADRKPGEHRTAEVFFVMPGLVPGIHVRPMGLEDVDGRDKPGHDDSPITVH